MKRAASLILALALALTLFPATAQAASPAYGSEVWLRDTALQEGVTLSENIFWSSGYDKPRHEYYITYTPSGGGSYGTDRPSTGTEADPLQPDAPPVDTDKPNWLLSAGASTLGFAGESGGPVVPVAAYGTSVCNRLTISEAARYYESIGYRVVGAINGDFYDTATGYPLGILISAGELLSGSSGYYAVGFRPDGSAVIGEPKLEITARTDTQSVSVSSINKPRVGQAGITMLTYGYRSDHDTGSSVATDGVNVLAAIVGGRISIGSEVTLQVEEVVEDASTRTLREDQVLLTIDANGYDTGLAFLRALVPGQLVTVAFSTPDPSWNDVSEAVGALYLLVANGQPQSDFEVSAAPRTAIGVKANGDVILYTIDGRQNTHSMGASLGVLAQRMAELGCVTALGLDGGGSTTALAALPDSTTAQVLNSPSDKTERKVSNHIFLLAPGKATGIAGSVYLTAGAPAVLAGHTVALSANLADTNYFPMGGPVQLEASAGEIAGSTFTAPQTGGMVTITAWSGNLSAQREVLVVDAPDRLSLQRGGSAVTTLTVAPGETVSLSAAASYNHMPLEIFPTDLTWTVDPAVGTIDANGVFSAALTEGTGVLTASRGSISASLTVTIVADSPFVDTEGHWAAPYISGLYHRGILTGVTVDGQLYAYPDNAVTRAEFSVLLARYMGLNPADYASVETPFTDLEPVESWAGSAIRAMYAMGIVNGIDPTSFGPQGTLTRAQAVTMLGRMLALQNPEPEAPDLPEGEEPAEPSEPPVPDASPDLPAEPDAPDASPDLPAEPGTPDGSLPPEPDTEPVNTAFDLSQFEDADKILPYAYEHFQTLVGLGAVDGVNGRLDPDGVMTRAAVCKALATLPQA